MQAEAQQQEIEETTSVELEDTIRRAMNNIELADE